MSGGEVSEVLLTLQPELLTQEELIQRIESRCSRIANLELMSKEGLVGLFRRMILPLPQRFYRTNRRGKMLTSRRAGAGLESKRKEEGFTGGQSGSRVSSSGDRLKPPPDSSTPRIIRIGSDGTRKKSHSATEQLNNEERRVNAEEEHRDSKMFRADFPSGRKISLKRPRDDEKPSASQTESKKQRTPIRWP